MQCLFDSFIQTSQNKNDIEMKHILEQEFTWNLWKCGELKIFRTIHPIVTWCIKCYLITTSHMCIVVNKIGIEVYELYFVSLREPLCTCFLHPVVFFTYKTNCIHNKIAIQHTPTQFFCYVKLVPLTVSSCILNAYKNVFIFIWLP